MNPLLIVASIFAMSLIAAVVLFKWLANTAVVKLPFGQFGGAIAGFIGVFLILQNSYSAFTPAHKPPEIRIPSNYNSYISEIFRIGFGYPKSLQFEEGLQGFQILGNILISDTANIIMGIQSLAHIDLGDISINQAREEILKNYFEPILGIYQNAKITNSSDYSVKGIQGKLYELSLSTNQTEIRQIHVAIPHFDNKVFYAFVLTSLPDQLNENRQKFMDILSTVEFF